MLLVNKFSKQGLFILTDTTTENLVNFYETNKDKISFKLAVSRQGAHVISLK